MTILCACAAVAQWASLYEPIAAANGLDARVVATVIWVESRGKADVISEVGAVGLMGVVPYCYKVADILDPAANIRIGAQRLAYGLAAGGSIRRALIAYHVGADGAERLGWERSLDGQAYLTAFRTGWAECWPGQPLPWAMPAREPEE